MKMTSDINFSAPTPSAAPSESENWTSSPVLEDLQSVPMPKVSEPGCFDGAETKAALTECDHVIGFIGEEYGIENIRASEKSELVSGVREIFEDKGDKSKLHLPDDEILVASGFWFYKFCSECGQKITVAGTSTSVEKS